MVPKHTTIPNTREKKTRQSFVHIPEIIGATLKNHVAPWELPTAKLVRKGTTVVP